LSSRDIFKLVYTRRGFRTTRRSIEESTRLAVMARELSQAYLEVVKWGREERILKLKK
jgi:uncharacterized protein (DUF2384 family)